MQYISGGSGSQPSQGSNPLSGDWPFTFHVPTKNLQMYGRVLSCGNKTATQIGDTQRELGPPIGAWLQRQARRVPGTVKHLQQMLTHVWSPGALNGLCKPKANTDFFLCNVQRNPPQPREWDLCLLRACHSKHRNSKTF